MGVPAAGVPGAGGSSAAAGAASAFEAATGGAAAAAGAAAAKAQGPIAQASARTPERITIETTRDLGFIKDPFFISFAQQFAYLIQVREFVAGFESGARISHHTRAVHQNRQG